MDVILSWSTLKWLLWLLYVPSCAGLIIIVLLQKGKGTGFAGAFGMGPGSEAVFGPRASKSLPVRMTYVMATIFVVLALALSIIEGKILRGSAPSVITESTETEADSSLVDEGLGSAYTTQDAQPPADGETPTSDAATTGETTPAEDGQTAAPAESPVNAPEAGADASQPAASETPASTAPADSADASQQPAAQ